MFNKGVNSMNIFNKTFMTLYCFDYPSKDKLCGNHSIHNAKRILAVTDNNLHAKRRNMWSRRFNTFFTFKNR